MSKDDGGNPYVRRWLGSEKDFDSAIDMASGTTREQRQQQFKESFERASLNFRQHGFIQSHPRILEEKAKDKALDEAIERMEVVVKKRNSRARRAKLNTVKKRGKNNGQK